MRDKRRNVSIFFGEKLNLGQWLTVLVPGDGGYPVGGGGGYHRRTEYIFLLKG